MSRIRELLFAPMWVVLTVLGAAIFGCGWLLSLTLMPAPTVIGRIDFLFVLTAILTTIVGAAIALRRHGYGGRIMMKEFFDAIRTRHHPENIDVDRWGMLISREIRSRQQNYRWSWALVATALIYLGIAIAFRQWPLVLPTAVFGAQFLWIRYSTQHILVGLDTLVMQGRARGYTRSSR